MRDAQDPAGDGMRQPLEIQALLLFPGDRIQHANADWAITYVAVPADGPITVRAKGTGSRGAAREFSFGRNEIIRRSADA